MTTKQKKQYKKELYAYLDFEYDDLTIINNLIKCFLNFLFSNFY